MTDMAADAFALPAATPPARTAGFGRYERETGAAAASLLVLNVLMLLGMLAVLWTPAVLFWAALALAPAALIGIVAITRGWWM
jgi:hypothetical protein